MSKTADGEGKIEVPATDTYLVQYTYQVTLPRGGTEKADELVKAFMVGRTEKPVNYTRAILSWLVDRFVKTGTDMVEEYNIQIQKIDDDYVQRGHV